MVSLLQSQVVKKFLADQGLDMKEIAKKNREAAANPVENAKRLAEAE